MALLRRSCNVGDSQSHGNQWHGVRYRAVSSCACQQPHHRLVIAAPLMDIRCRSSGDEFQSQVLQGIKELQQQMGTMQHQMGTMQHQMGTMQHQMGTMQHQMGTMEQRMGKMEQQMEQRMKAVQKQIQSLQRDQGYILEAQAKKVVGQMFGADYSRQLLAQSLQDLALLLPISKEDEVLLRPLEFAQRASKQLVDNFVPDRLLRAIYRGLAKSDPTLPPWFDQNGKLLGGTLGAFIGSCKDEALKEGLIRLRKVALMSQQDQYMELLKCDSAGIMCVIASALPALYLDEGSNSSSISGADEGSSPSGSNAGSNSSSDSGADEGSSPSGSNAGHNSSSDSGADEGSSPSGGNAGSNSSSDSGADKRVSPVSVAKLLPSWVLEFGFSGRMEVGADYAYIDVGEAKLTVDYASAVPQLGVRLSVLRWLVRVCFDVPSDGIRCVGRLFVSRGRKSAGLDAQQNTMAKDTWHYSLYLHEV